MQRRAFLAAGATAAGVALGVSRSTAGTPGMRREPTGVLMAGTPHETPVYVVEGDSAGPTAVVVGGMHGDERSGYLAAERVADWSVDAGRLVVLPRANRVAIERDTRRGEGGDLNRQFPPGARPTTALARGIWDRLVEAEPDVVVNLHSSKGIYGTHQEFVGQAVFPTAAGDAVAVAEETVATLNDAVVPWYMPLHDFLVGNVLHGTAPLLTHKVGGDLGRPAYIVEATEFLVDPETGARWTERAATELLTRHGLERTGEDR
ncbi:M99 family carboxypeptidase catalytic domain-containing protein [Halorarius litoreus]|uniref:M99 family carboxypeptidase catalytic domain-containing protein n=1 Tax=Halorarius litoreus TaxID=2962676 RepID=UPI0020CD7EC9|nr:succinylglutamate desuccinylase/aspartoacylase family protein [Halorarius litoreus]